MGMKYECLAPLSKEGPPVIIVAVVQESEAIAYACRENGIDVLAFCDSQKVKSQELFCGLEVIHTPTLPKRFSEARLIIASQHIPDCIEQLSAMGYNNFYSAKELLENYDVRKNQHLISQSYMEERISSYMKGHSSYFDGENTHMRSLDVMVTTKCSLKCKSCSNLMQYYTNPENTDHEKILTAIEIINENVDDISEYRLIGGEPLMNKGWAKIVDGIIEKNPERKIFIYTNGTIAPKDEQLETFQGGNVNFVITDYGKLSRNINKLTNKLSEFNISFVSTPAELWVDCSSISHHKRSASELEEVFKQCCVKYIYTLLNGRVYRCPFIANAANLNAIPDNPVNYVDLFSKKSNVKKQLLKLIKEVKFFPGCDFCDGRPYDPSNNLGYDGIGMIEPGIQTSEPLPYKLWN